MRATAVCEPDARATAAHEPPPHPSEACGAVLRTASAHAAGSGSSTVGAGAASRPSNATGWHTIR